MTDSLTKPVFVAIEGLSQFIDKFENECGEEFLDGDVIVFCPASKALGVLSEDGRMCRYRLS